MKTKASDNPGLGLETPAVNVGTTPPPRDVVTPAPASSLVKAAEPPRSVPTVRADENGNISPSQLIMAALDRGIPAESLEKLVALQERMEDRNARKEFARALAKFKTECPVITKSRHVAIEGRSSSYGYDYAPLEEAYPVMEPFLESNGFTVKWDRTVDGKGMLTSVCTLRHEGGHSDSSSFTLPTESSNPGMSVQHKYSGAATFADRKSLFAVLGIVAEKEEAAAAREVDPTPVSEDQFTDLQDRMDERLKGKPAVKAAEWRKKFLAHFGVETLAKLRAVDYQAAIVALEAPAKEVRS